MNAMITQLNNISTHSDLNLAENPTARTPDFTTESSWAEYSSSKFQFLGYFIDAAVDLHVLIMAKPGKTVDIVKNYLLGKGFSMIPKESDNDSSALVFVKDSLSFEIRLTTGERIMPPYKSPAIMIALDSSFDADDPATRELRVAADSERLVPVVRLIISNSAEHVERCLPAGSDISRLRLLVQHTTSLRGSVGDLQDDALGVQENAEETLLYLMSDPATRNWPLAAVENLGIESSEESPSLEPEELRAMSSSRQKRWLVSLAAVKPRVLLKF